MKKLPRHDNVLALLGTSMAADGAPLIVTQLCAGGNVLEFLLDASDRGHTPPRAERAKILRDACAGFVSHSPPQHCASRRGVPKFPSRCARLRQSGGFWLVESCRHTGRIVRRFGSRSSAAAVDGARSNYESYARQAL